LSTIPATVGGDLGPERLLGEEVEPPRGFTATIAPGLSVATLLSALAAAGLTLRRDAANRLVIDSAPGVVAGGSISPDLADALLGSLAELHAALATAQLRLLRTGQRPDSRRLLAVVARAADEVRAAVA
jgi:hypothetical protein